MATKECECLSCGHIFHVDEDTLRAGEGTTCPKCGYDFCNPEGAKKQGSGSWTGPLPKVQRRDDNESFWPRH
jgi:DNA-directed RNA polymerase subunit RPC12/RpoP